MEYFVSFSYVYQGHVVFGNAVVQTTGGFASMSSVRETEDLLMDIFSKDHTGANSFVIISWQKF